MKFYLNFQKCLPNTKHCIEKHENFVRIKETSSDKLCTDGSELLLCDRWRWHFVQQRIILRKTKTADNPIDWVYKKKKKF